MLVSNENQYFIIPQETATNGNSSQKEMKFGNDEPTRIFRNFVHFFVKYRQYAEDLQKLGKTMDPVIERFFKVT